jgi:hypothetical protein
VSRGRTLAGTALVSCGVLLLTTTQPWVRTVREVAAGAPRARGEVGALELVPWLAPVAVVAGLAVIAGLAGMRWARPVAAVAAAAAVVGTAAAVLGAGRGAVVGGGVVDESTTGWLWVGAAAAVLLALSTVRWAAVSPRGPGADPSGGTVGGAAPGDDPDDPDDEEARRRQEAQDWRDLSQGRDPTDG